MSQPLRLVVPDRAYEIDKGIPIPPRSCASKYPWADMKVGDSFFVPGNKTRCEAVQAAAKYRSQRTAEKYVTRTKPNGVRVWRAK